MVSQLLQVYVKKLSSKNNLANMKSLWFSGIGTTFLFLPQQILWVFF